MTVFQVKKLKNKGILFHFTPFDPLHKSNSYLDPASHLDQPEMIGGNILRDLESLNSLAIFRFMSKRLFSSLVSKLVFMNEKSLRNLNLAEGVDVYSVYMVN